jgi:hypothetical protein
MPNNVTDILVSAARVYYAPFGAALPADSVGVNVPWGTTWVEVGYTTAPCTLTYKYTDMDVSIQQELATVKRVKTAEELTLETTLGEFSLSNLNIGIGGQYSRYVAASGQMGKEELLAGGYPVLTERAWGFEGFYVDETGIPYPLRVFGKEKHSDIGLQVKALADMNRAVGQRLVKFQRIMEPSL